jgi:hypothetical protein
VGCYRFAITGGTYACWIWRWIEGADSIYRLRCSDPALCVFSWWKKLRLLQAWSYLLACPVGVWQWCEYMIWARGVTWLLCRLNGPSHMPWLIKPSGWAFATQLHVIFGGIFSTQLHVIVGMSGMCLAVVRVHGLGTWSDPVAMSFEWT